VVVRGSPNKAVEGTGPGVSGFEFCGVVNFSVSWRVAASRSLTLIVSRMLCESCHQKPATLHTSKIIYDAAGVAGTTQEQHFCEQCADVYHACTPGLNHLRDLICLSDFYRSRLYDLLETSYPAAFEGSDNLGTEARIERVKCIQAFLREQLKKDGIELNESGFLMLYGDFIGSYHFYTRKDEFNKRKG